MRTEKAYANEHAKGDKCVRGRNVKKLKDSSEKPLGQWNNYDIICKDDWVVLLLNGVLQNVATQCSVTSDKICLQSEGMLIECQKHLHRAAGIGLLGGLCIAIVAGAHG